MSCHTLFLNLPDNSYSYLLTLFRLTAKHAIFFSGQLHHTRTIISCYYVLFYNTCINLDVFSLYAVNLFKDPTSMVSTFDDAVQRGDRFLFTTICKTYILSTPSPANGDLFFLWIHFLGALPFFDIKKHTSYQTCVYIPSYKRFDLSRLVILLLFLFLL